MPTEEEQQSALVVQKKKHDETEEVLNKLVTLLEGRESILKLTKAANEKAADRSWEREDEIVAAETTIGYALQRLEDTSIYMGDVERRLAKLHEETTENNELLEETFMVQKETTKPWRR